MRRAAGESGYSLVEVSVLAAVVGIMAAVAIPSLRGILPRLRLASNTSLLVNEIALCQKRAAAQARDHRISFDLPSATYTLERYDLASPGPPQAYAWVGLGRSAMTGTTITGVSGFSAPAALVARASGSMDVPLAQQGIITLATPDRSLMRRIVVEPHGRVFVQRWAGGGAWADE